MIYNDLQFKQKNFFLYVFFILSTTHIIGVNKTEKISKTGINAVSNSSLQKLVKNIDSMAQDPFLLLDDLEKAITSQKMTLSGEEREFLICHLENLKNNFCNRSMISFLGLPIMATIFLGIKSWFYWECTKFDGGSVFFSTIHDENVKSFMNAFFYFLMAIGVTILLEIEHCENVLSLFRKELKIKKRIDDIIASLNN